MVQIIECYQPSLGGMPHLHTQNISIQNLKLAQAYYSIIPSSLNLQPLACHLAKLMAKVKLQRFGSTDLPIMASM